MAIDLPATRAEATKLGLTQYFTGRPCIHGHTAPRLATSKTCLECCRAANARWRLQNLEKDRARHQAKRAANPEKYRGIKQRSAQRAYAAWREAQASRPRPECCEVCSAPPSGKYKTLVWDHVHETGAFRGWLCFGCNFALGNAKDNPATLRALAAYLEISR